MSTKKILTFLLVLAITVVGFGDVAVVNAVQTTKTYVEIEDSSAKVWEITPGATTSVVIPVKATAIYIYNPTIEVAAADENSPFTFTAPKLTTSSLPLGAYAIETSGTTYINFDIMTRENAKIGKYPINLDISFTTPTYTEDGTIENAVTTQRLSIVAKVTKEKAPAQLVIKNLEYDEDSAAIGNDVDITFDVQNDGEITALNSYVVIDYNETNIIAGYSNDNIKIGDLKPGESKKVSLSMKILTTATEGIKTLNAGFSYKDPDGESYTSSKKVLITVKKTSTQASEKAKLVISSTSTNNEVNAGNEYNLKGVIKNIGMEKASNVEVSIQAGTGVTTGIIPNFDTQVVLLDNVGAGKSVEFSLPLLVTDTAAAGLSELTIQVSYTDTEGNSKTTVAPFYVTVVKPEDKVESSDIVISNVSQSPSTPLVGEQVTITFDVENRGNKAVTGVSVGGESLETSGFEPLTAQTYQDIGTIEANSKKTVTMYFKVGSNAVEGLNAMTIGCKYTDANEKKQSTTSNIYILDIINDSNSKPKIIVSDISKDTDELNAGSTFLFTYTLKNTHATKAAKNIKVTISQAEDIFSATQGTNTAYIDRIDAGEEVQNSIEMRVKSDVKTGAYELEIKVEYEYDNMSKADTEAGGVTETSKLKLRAIEKIRFNIQNLSVGLYGEMPYVNQSSSLSFELINMGKSQLDNVSFSLEGDFTLESGASYYFGTVQPGNPEFVELMVIPTMAGMCGGTLIISFEDSNGEPVELRHEFSDINVGEFVNPDFGGDYTDPGMPSFNEGEGTEAKKDIMPVWLFILIQFAILAIFIPVVRIVIIRCYKKKLRKKEEDL